MKLLYPNFREWYLNIVKNKNTHKIVTGNTYINYTIVDKYKYSGVWLDKKLNPDTHIKTYKPKVNYLISRLKILKNVLN